MVIDCTEVSFYSLRKALELFPGACPVTDQHFNVCFIGLSMHFGFEKIKNCLFHRAMQTSTFTRFLQLTLCITAFITLHAIL